MRVITKMKTLLLALIVSVSLPAQAGMAFFKYERVSGMNKICIYNHLGSEVAITIAAYKLCPLSINT
jgi:hypothetical protein